MSKPQTRDLERTCLRRLAEGDVSVLEILWELHGNRSFRHALWVTGRREDAEDVVQTIFVRIAGLGAALLGVRDLTSYLGAMVHHEAVAVAKRRVVQEGHGVPDPDALLSVESSPDDEAERRAAAVRVAALPADQREVVVLHLWENLTFREIGRVTGVSTFTAASRFRLAKRRLRQAFERRTR